MESKVNEVKWWHDKNIWIDHLKLRQYSDLSLGLSVLMVLFIIPAAYIAGAALVVILFLLSVYYLIYGWLLDIAWHQPPDVEIPPKPIKDFPENELSFSYIVFKMPIVSDYEVSVEEFSSIKEVEYEAERDEN